MSAGDDRSLFAKISIAIFLLVDLAAFNLVARADIEAYKGQPFGVARVTVPVFRGEPSLPLNDERFTVLEATGRAFYPVVKTEPARQFLRGLLGIETPRNVTIYFLFRGDEPFDLSVYSPVEQGTRVVPQNDPSGHRRLYDQWWQQTTERWTRLQKDPQFPPIGENFLVALFARRMNREVPEVGSGLLGLQKKHSALGELLGGEAAQLAVHRQLILGSNQPDAQPEPVPPTPEWPALQIDPTGLDEVEIEPIAEHVPEECFYIRFGNFVNYFWFRDFNTKWDGDLQNMIARRALRRLATSRVEQQLSMKENALSRILGPQFIIDAALIGGDPYLQQGAAVGILAQARNNQLLSQDFMRQRRMTLETFPDATESTIQLAGKDVSLIATPDGRVRSYYAQSGDFHLVTTSRKIAERFLEATDGKGSLADLPSFRNARKQLQTKRDDTVFVFLSEKFFQNLCSPKIWAESRRRRQSMQEPLVVDLARYAAKCEGLDATTPEQLIEAGLLPTGFGQHIDNATVTETVSGFLDSLRGAPGYYLPVGDVAVESFSPTEVAAYREFIQAFNTEVGQLPPIAIALHRDPTDLDKLRTLTIDFLAAPLGTVKLGTVIDSLGEPVNEQLKPVEGNIGSLEVVLDLPVPLIGGENQPHMLFAGLRDYRSPLAVSHGRLVAGAERSELVRGYIGAWPRPGLLKMLQGADGPPGPQPQAIGETMWQAQSDNFLLISFKPDVIQQVQPQLGFEQAERPAQVRMHINDLTDTQFSETLNAFGYMRVRETSVAPARLMNSLANLLEVPREECLDFAQRLLDGTFACPLDGQYELFESEGSLPIWSSSALPAQNRNLLTEVPADFHLPMLTWFKGMTGDLLIEGGALSGHTELQLTSEALP